MVSGYRMATVKVWSLLLGYLWGVDESDLKKVKAMEPVMRSAASVQLLVWKLVCELDGAMEPVMLSATEFRLSV